jgi:CubicO group peptidase (beta-lactamase class C family)
MSGVAPRSEGTPPPMVPDAPAHRLVHELLLLDRLPGVSLAVMAGGDLVVSEALGWASLEPPRPATAASRFRVASVSKSLTSVALGLLWQEGTLDLDAEVQVYVPAFPRHEQPITVRQLAGHLSGLPHYTAADMLNRQHYHSVTAALAKFADRPPLHAPGERFSYSSFGWNLLAAVVEAASGAEFLRFMAQRVFRPLGLRSTGPDVADAPLEERVAFYFVRGGGEVTEAPAIDNSDAWASAGFLSTAEDLVRFARGVLDGTLLEPRTVDLLLAPMRTNAGEATQYGLGWELGEYLGYRVVGHGGSHVGATAQLLAFPEREVYVALLANANSAGLRATAAMVAELYLSAGARGANAEAHQT